MTDVLRLLPDFQWRGVRYPVTARSASFAHDNARHQIQYTDGVFVEQLGAQAWTFSYTIPMREDVARGPFKNLFTDGLPILVRDFRNREPGELVDPVYGTFRCAPSSFTDDSDPNKRDGTDIHVEFVHAPELDETPDVQNPGGLSGLVADAGQLDVVSQAADWEQEPSPEGMSDVLSSLNGLMRQGLAVGDKLSAACDDVIFKVSKLEDTANKVASPQSWAIRNSARRVRDMAMRVKENQGPTSGSKTKVIVTTTPATVSGLALLYGMTVKEMLELNPWMAQSPSVPAGSSVKVKR